MVDTFNYYDDAHGFLSRSLLVMLSEARIVDRDNGKNFDASESFYEELRIRSDDFSKVKLSIQVNDLDVERQWRPKFSIV
jgi:hypothetical protein